MHWEEFQAILESLPDDTILPKLFKSATGRLVKAKAKRKKSA